MKEVGIRQISELDRLRQDEATLLRKYGNIAALLYAEIIGTQTGLNDDTKVQIANSIMEKDWNGRKELFCFTDLVDTMIQSSNGRLNPGVHESDLAYATRRLTVIQKLVVMSTRLNDPSKIDTSFIPVAVDGYLSSYGLGVNNLSIVKKH